MMRRLLRGGVVAAVLLTGLAVVPPGTAVAQDAPEVRPMIFVHGGLGSGQQFEAQALRFASNGYPADHIDMFEHDSLAYPGSQAEVWARLDAMIADVLAATGAEQVNLLGHSQGTGLLQGYLNSDPARAGNVAQYVNLDGGSGGSVPDSVEALAVWGEGDPDRELVGATNVHLPEQGHTEVVNSPETFVEIYRFFTGEEPAFREVVREPPDEIEVSGRAQLFPANTGATDAVLEIYEVDPTTGRRLAEAPEATYQLSGDGTWGPFDADGDAFYEFAIVRDTGTHHVYLQRFVRSNRWVRLLTSEPGGLADSFWEQSDAHTNMVLFRNKEWWGDQGDRSDSLEIAGQSILNEATSPRANRTIGIFVHDHEVDGQSDLSEPVAPLGVPFLTGIDLHIPAASPPDATVAIVTTPRLGAGPEAVCVPNWASSTDRVSIQLSSYHHLLDIAGNPAAGHANPACAVLAAAPEPPAPAPVPAPGTTPRPAAPVRAQPSYTG